MAESTGSTGQDYISGSLGKEAGANAVGKDIQHVSVNLGDRSPQEAAAILRQLNQAVFGDGLGWDGVVRQLRELQREVERLATQVTTLQNEMHTLKQQMSGRKETSRQMLVLLWVVAAMMLVLMGIALWPLLT